MEMILIEPNSTEWEYIWNWLEQHPLNNDVEDKRLALNNGEGWQYMGSWRQGKKVIHELRHRNHPATQTVQKLSLNASDSLTDEQINKKFSI
jgi:hypothetical protein